MNQTDINTNNSQPSFIAEIATKLICACGIVKANQAFINDRANRGWTAAEIARSYVRNHFSKGDKQRRQMLTTLTKLGAKAK